MAYLGRGLDKISNIEVLDNITFDGSSSYSITKGSVAFTPNSAQSCLISIDGVVQATNFTVSSSTIDFGVAIPSTSVCNFFLHYGTGVMTVPSDGCVTTAKLGNDAVTTAKITDANVTSAKMFSGFANGITEADQWRLTADITTNTNPISANLERNDSTGFGYIGTGMSVSSGIWTFPSTGIWSIRPTLYSDAIANDNILLYTEVTTDNSSYSTVMIVSDSGDGSATGAGHATGEYLFDCTDTSTHKIKFRVESITSGSKIIGTTTYNTTFFTFTRLGDT